MATFPAIAPVHPAPKQTSVSSGAFLFGDGYERATRFGVNSVRPEWRLTWEVSAADVATIEAFLQARADAGDSFDWQPPDAVIALRWRCDEWGVEQVAHNWFRLSATFRRVFELAIAPVLTPAAATCIDDALCGSDLGPKPSITYTALSVDQLLTASINYSLPQNIPFVGLCNTPSWQWYRNGAEIAGATASTYTLVQADLNSEITVAVFCFGYSPGVSDPVNVGSCRISNAPGQPVTGTISPTGTNVWTWTSRIWTYNLLDGYGNCGGNTYGINYGPGTSTTTGGVTALSIVTRAPQTGSLWGPPVPGPCGGFNGAGKYWTGFATVRPDGSYDFIASFSGLGYDTYTYKLGGLTVSSTEPDAVDAATYFGACSTVFDPTQYQYFRWKGTVSLGATSPPNPRIESFTSQWYNRSTALYPRLLVDHPYGTPAFGGNFIPPKGTFLAPWVANVTVVFNMTNATPDYFPYCNATNWSGNILYITVGGTGNSQVFPTSQTYSTCYEPTAIETNNTLIATSGVWEFSNNQSQVLAAWGGA